MPIPKTAIQFWAGGRMPSRYVRFMDSVRRHNPEWRHILLNEKKAEELTGKPWAELKRVFGSYCSISNYVRLLAVARYGGIWLDADCECIKPLDSLLGVERGAFAAVVDNVAEHGAPDRICCAVFGATPSHPWVKWQIDNFKRFELKDPAWGVPLMSCAPRELVTLLPTEFFFPWHWESGPEQQKLHASTLIAHHWDGDWRPCQ